MFSEPHYSEFAPDSAEDIVLRKNWLSFSAEDEELIKEVDELLETNIDPLIDDMYAHFLSFPETRKFFPSESILERAQTAQKAYFRRMTKGNYGQDYVKERIAVGTTHYRIGLDPVWYLGAYNRVSTWLRRLVHEKYKDDHEKAISVVSALNRLIFFDMGLAIESYTIAKEKSIREQRDAIKELETQRRVTKSMVEDAPIGIARLDRNLQIVECNSEFISMVEQAGREGTVGCSLSDVIPSLSTKLFEQVVECGLPEKRSAEPLHLAASSEQLGYYDWAIWPIKDESAETTGLVLMFVDATDRVKLQQQREDFVATLTHDLKTPILAANRAIKLLMDGDFGAVVDAQSKVLETIHQSNSALYKMVQTLLDVYRYDSGVKKLSLAKHNLTDTVLGTVQELRPLCDTKKVGLELNLPESPCWVVYDAEEIRRVLQNLLDNSLKFTPAGGTISLDLQKVDSQLRIVVADTGKGISEEDRPKLFQRFWQAAGSGRYYASTGLGLYLCHKIVELHGGKISCESTLGHGSKFKFTLPLDLIETKDD